MKLKGNEEIKIKKVHLEETLNAMIYTCSPYLDGSKSDVKMNQPWIYDLVEAYNTLYLANKEDLPEYKLMRYYEN